jgi:hypothetical protein
LTGVLGGLAGSSSSGISVVILEILSVLLGIYESVGLPSTIASVGLGVAINELLLGEGEELAGSEEVSTLNSGSSGESPA